MQSSVEILDWDSEFFGVKVAQIAKNSFSDDTREDILNKLINRDVRLGYYISDGPFEDNENDLYDFILVNQRVPIRKELKGAGNSHKNIHPYDKQFPEEQLLSLANRAAEWSRFKLDPNISSQKVSELYKIWIINSLKRDNNSEILVYSEKGILKGFVTLSFHPPHGKTPLFAVSKEAEGKGVSFALMRAADTFLYQNGCSYYTSATQADNRAAITVFKRHGFEISPAEYVYHLWKKK